MFSKSLCFASSTVALILIELRNQEDLIESQKLQFTREIDRTTLEEIAFANLCLLS